MAHEDARAVAVIEGEAQLLHVGEDVAPHVKLRQHAHAVAVDGDDVEEDGFEDIGRRHQQHHREEGAVEVCRQQAVEAHARDVGEDQVDQRHRHRAAHIQKEQPLVPRDVLREDLQGPVVVVDFVHGITGRTKNEK